MDTNYNPNPILSFFAWGSLVIIIVIVWVVLGSTVRPADVLRQQSVDFHRIEDAILENTLIVTKNQERVIENRELIKLKTQDRFTASDFKKWVDANPDWNKPNE